MKLSHLTLLLIEKNGTLGSYETLFCMRMLCNIYNSIFIGNLSIFPLILQRDIVSINRLTLIQKIIEQCDVKHIIILRIKTMTSVMKVQTCIFTSITALPIGRAVILAIMSILTFIAAVILYIWNTYLCSIDRDFISQNMHVILRLYPMTTHST